MQVLTNDNTGVYRSEPSEIYDIVEANQNADQEFNEIQAANSG